MTRVFAKAVLKVLKGLGRRPVSRLESALSNPLEMQQAVFKEAVKALSLTEYGKSCGIHQKIKYENFKQLLPIVRYEEIEASIVRQQETKRPVLSHGRVLFYQETSGSSGPRKIIPYTRQMKNALTNMFLLWAHDVLLNGPCFQTARLFAGISPKLKADEHDSGDDARFLNPPIAWMARQFLVYPLAVSKVKELENFKHVLSLYLLAAYDLEIVSVWNPTYFLVLLDYMNENREAIARDWRNGSVTREGIHFRYEKPDLKRERLFLSENNLRYSKLWRHLKLFSCWAHANAAAGAGHVRKLFPDVFVQPKGLLATEAPVTVPLVAAKGCVPLVHQVFLEFMKSNGAVLRLHELEPKEEYEIIITQPCGLSRYLLGDRVRVTDLYKKTPCLEFVGRGAQVSDLVGEKLSEDFVRQTVEAIIPPECSFPILIPQQINHRYGYMLLVDRLNQPRERLAEQLEARLQSSYRYREAAALGQLSRARVKVVSGLPRIYFEHYVSQGMSWGDIKHQYLVTRLEDAARMSERFHEAQISRI